MELYSTSWCSFCKSARAYFKARGIPITEYDVEDDEAALKRFRAMNPGGGVPYAVIDGKGIFGFNEEAYDAVLGPNPDRRLWAPRAPGRQARSNGEKITGTLVIRHDL